MFELMTLHLVFPSSLVAHAGPLYIIMEGYLQLDRTQHYTFQLLSQNIGVSLKIDGRSILEYTPQAEGKSTARVVLQHAYIHSVSIEIQSFSNSTKSLAMFWKTNDDEEFQEFTNLFFNFKSKCFNNICLLHLSDLKLSLRRPYI